MKITKKTCYTIIFKTIWIICCISVLVFSTYAKETNDSFLVIICLMLVLSFPTSLLVSGGISLLVLLQERNGVDFIKMIIPESIAGVVILWLIFFISGYFQWFWLLPTIYSKTAGYIKKHW